MLPMCLVLKYGYKLNNKFQYQSTDNRKTDTNPYHMTRNEMEEEPDIEHLLKKFKSRQSKELVE